MGIKEILRKTGATLLLSTHEVSFPTDGTYFHKSRHFSSYLVGFNSIGGKYYLELSPKQEATISLGQSYGLNVVRGKSDKNQAYLLVRESPVTEEADEAITNGKFLLFGKILNDLNN